MPPQFVLTHSIASRELQRLAGTRSQIAAHELIQGDTVNWRFEVGGQKFALFFPVSDLLLSLDDFSLRHLAALATHMKTALTTPQ